MSRARKEVVNKFVKYSKQSTDNKRIATNLFGDEKKPERIYTREIEEKSIYQLII